MPTWHDVVGWSDACACSRLTVPVLLLEQREVRLAGALIVIFVKRCQLRIDNRQLSGNSLATLPPLLLPLFEQRLPVLLVLVQGVEILMQFHERFGEPRAANSALAL